MYVEAIDEYKEALRVSGGGTVLTALLGHAYALFQVTPTRLVKLMTR
jgi:hypothetical protein